jgi:DNA-3-methyladenine glycosylase II
VNPADQIRRDARTIVRRDPRLAADGIPLGVEVWGGGYPAVVRLIQGQLVSIEAADAMWANLMTALGEVTPETIAHADPTTLRRCGFTARKAEYARAIGDAGVDFDALDSLALRIGWREIAGQERPSEAELRDIATQWSPHRTAASYLIWSKYLRNRRRV